MFYSDWTSLSFDDSSWYKTTLPSSSIKSNRAQYYRFQFSGIPSVAAYEIHFTYSCGIVLYLNSQEIFRDNLAAGSTTYSTLATICFSTVQSISLIRSGSQLSSGINVLGMEIHPRVYQLNSFLSTVWLALYSPNDSSSKIIHWVVIRLFLCFNPWILFWLLWWRLRRSLWFQNQYWFQSSFF